MGIGIDTDLNDAEEFLRANVVFMIAEWSFCAFFTVELIIRWMAFLRKVDCIKDRWFLVDFLLVVVMICETILIPAYSFATSSSSKNQNANSTAILKVAKAIKLLRMLRISRIMRKMPEMFILVKAIVAASRAVFFTLLLLVVIIYAFAITFRILLKDSAKDETPLGVRFTGVPKAMQSLFVHTTLLDSISTIMDEAQEEPEPWVITILLYVIVIIAAITIMNMLIGILCETITGAAEAERNLLQLAQVEQTLKGLLEMGFDEDQDGLISRNEFEMILSNKDCVKALEEIEIDVVGLVDVGDTIFANTDEKGSFDMSFDRKLKFREFMEVLLQFRGSDKATVKDMMMLRRDVARTHRKLDHMWQADEPRRSQAFASSRSLQSDCGRG